MTTLILFTTAGCHLCDQAEVILNAMNVQIDKVEIGDDDDLVDRYGIRIPVLKFTDNSELNWPFEQHDIITRIQQLPT